MGPLYTCRVPLISGPAAISKALSWRLPPPGDNAHLPMYAGDSAKPTPRNLGPAPSISYIGSYSEGQDSDLETCPPSSLSFPHT